MNRCNFGDDVVSNNRNSRDGASSSKGPNATTSSGSSRPTTATTTQPVSDARTGTKSLLIPPSDAISVASSTNTNNSSSAAAGSSRRRGGKNRNNRSKRQQQQGENSSSGNSNTTKDFGVLSSGIPAPIYGTKSNSGNSSSKSKKKTNTTKWAQASDAAAQGKKSPSSSFHLPQMKLELRKVLHGHLKRYEKEISSLQQQQLSNKEGEVDHRENTLSSEETGSISINALPTEGGESKEENDLTVKWLSPEWKLKRQIACTNAQCMMLLIRDLIRGISATNTSSSTGLSPPTLEGENFFWNASNIRFRLDQNSFQNVLWEWTYPPSIAPPTPLGFEKDDGLLWDTSSKGATSVLDELGNLLSKVAIHEENNNKMDSANVHVRILNLQPPRKSRRRGEVSGIVYFILSPDVNSITAELKRQQNLGNFRSRQHLVSAAVSKPPVIVTDVVVTSEEYPTNLETGSLPRNCTADHVESSPEVTAPVELLPVDNTKVTAFARLILDSAVEKLQSHCTTLSPLLGLSISHNQKSFPEPKYHHQPIQPDNRRRRLRGETRLENTIEKSEDYLEFLKLYEAHKGEVPMVLADEQQAASTQRVVETATTSNSITGGGTATEPPVAALVAHLQMKRREEEEKKTLAAKQRRAQLSKKTSSNVSGSKSTKGKGGTHTQVVTSLAQGTKASKPTTAGSRISNTQTGNEAKGSKNNSRSKGGGNNKSKKKTLGSGGGTMNTALVTTIIKPRAGSS